MHRFTIIVLAGLALSGGVLAQPSAPLPAKPPAAKAPHATGSFEDALLAELDRLVAALPDTPESKTHLPQFERLFDLAIAHADLNQRIDALIETGAWRRIVGQLTALKPELRARVFPTLLANPVLARRLALTLSPSDKPEEVYTVLASLIEQRPKALADSANMSNLVAAICVVFDKDRFPPRRPDGLTPEQVRALEKARARNSRQRPAPDRSPGLPPAEAIAAAEAFDYFAANYGRMLFAPASTPPELLVHIVDIRASIDDLRWAQKRYQSNRNIGMVYGSIAYDTNAFQYGSEKKIWQADGGYTLENIKKVGGVCEEQAYFAAHCGKAIGVPTVEVSVSGPDVAHAYVGYLARRGDNTLWDFREGRYDEYEDIRGNITDPQTGRIVSHSQVGLSAGLLRASARDLAASIVLVDAAQRIGRARAVGVEEADADAPLSGPRTRTGTAKPKAQADATYPPTPDPAWPAPTLAARPADSATHDMLLKAAVEAAPGYAPAWLAAAKLGEIGEMSGADKNEWCRAVMRLCSLEFPDFAMEIISPLIRSTDGAKAQCDLWDWCAKQFISRPDLVARSRFNQAQAWAEARELGKAWAILREVANKYPNDGTVVVDALAAVERLLSDEGKPAAAAIPIFEDAFRRISKPEDVAPSFERQSNFFRVGMRLSELYDDAGEKNKAKMVRNRLDVDEE